MGTICILLGCIVFCVFVLVGCAGGISLADFICNTMVAYAQSRNLIVGGVIAACALIGLLICLSLVMHGLTYNKVNKIYRLMNVKKSSKKQF